MIQLRGSVGFRCPPVVAALLRAPFDEDGITLLVAAAVGEINRELGSVTDEEELRVLAELLAP